MKGDAPPVIVLDSFAVLAYLDGEAGMNRVQNVLQAAQKRQARVILPLINLGEVLYISERERGMVQAQRALAALEQLPLEILGATRNRVLSAAHPKANYRISSADAFVVAAAQELNAIVLTGDPEFTAVEAAGFIRVEWLARSDTM